MTDPTNAYALHHTGTIEIETERILLRRFCHSDNEDMLRNWISDPAIQSLISEPVYSTKREVAELLIAYIESYEKSDYYRWAIVLKETNECIGQIAYFLMDSENHFGEIEYCIGSQFQGRGYATECTRAIIDFGFRKIQLNKVQICHKANNAPSKRVIEKCGLKYDGTLRDFFFFYRKYLDRLLEWVFCI